MIVLPTTEEEIRKESKIPALIQNRFGAEMIVDLYTAKRLAVKNECEILDENFNFTEENAETNAKKPAKTDTESEK
jgi:hypothetical protein